MKLKRLTAALTAVICCAGAFAAFPEMTQPARASEAVHNDFESSYEGWYANADAATLTAEAGIGYAGTRGMRLSGRTSPEDGATSSKGFYLYGGIEYTYDIQVKSQTDETFHLSLLTIDEETGKETVKELTSKNVKAGEWTALTASYRAPADSYEFRLTVTTDSTADFLFDDVEITTKQSTAVVSAATAEKGLKDEFAHYFRVGNILNGGTIRNSAITANIIKDFNSIECENETKPDATLNQSQCSGTNIGVKLDGAAAIMDFCSKNGIAMRGHTLVWHSQTPSWFFKEGFNANGAWVNEATMDARMESYIKNMFAAIEQQYPDLNLYAYDVCNECMTDDMSRSSQGISWREPGDGNGKSAWVQVYGDNDFIEKAFTYARKYAPEGCDLYYNDYNEYWDHKRDNIYAKAKDLYQKGLLDGVGMQSHVPANATGFAGTDSYIEAMKKYLSIGCDVQITELDISLENGKYSLQDQANKYKAIFQAAMDWNDNPQSDGRVTAVCIWGPNDANSWLSAGSNALLYDSNNQPKLAYTTLTGMIPQSEWGDGTAPDFEGSTGGPTTVEPNEYGWYFHHRFEGDEEGWTGRGPATVAASDAMHYLENGSLYVSGRTDAWNGATYSLNRRAFQPGNEYSFSVNVAYTDGNDTEAFYLKLEYVDGSGETQYSTIAEGTAVKGEWMQLVNTNYEIPADATDMKIYVETPEGSTIDFYMDEAIGAVGGTGIQGAGQPEIRVNIKGDVNGDGIINVVDLGLAKRGFLKGFADANAEKCADVDESGKVEVIDLVYLTKYLLAMIDEFPVVEKPSTPVDTAKMEALFASVTPAGSYKLDGENNPLYTQRFGADPGYMVYDGRLYVYMTNDDFEYDSNGQIKENSYDVQEISVISSADLVNWTDHGLIQVAGANGAAKWAFASWAPCACHKTINGKEKFFLYFANSGGGIGVLQADSPTGPWTDPLGHALVTGQTPNCSGVVWMFDPAVLVDDDGTGYLYFGGGVPEGKAADPGTARAVKLGDDMISLAGTPVTINPPYLFEDSGINKIGNTYVYSYCTNWNTGGNPYGFSNAQIAYMTSDNPLGPFTYKGMMFPNPGDMGGGGNNHHSLVEFKGKYYMLYHSRIVEDRKGVNKNYRTPQIDEVTVNGLDISCKGTLKGVSQIEKLDPYTTVQAETMSNQSKDISVSGLGNTTVKGTKGSWIKTSGANFSKGCATLTVRAASASGAAIKVCTGSTSGDVVGYVEIPAGGMTDVTVKVNSVSGSKDLYFVFSGDLEFDSWSFA